MSVILFTVRFFWKSACQLRISYWVTYWKIGKFLSGKKKLQPLRFKPFFPTLTQEIRKILKNYRENVEQILLWGLYLKIKPSDFFEIWIAYWKRTVLGHIAKWKNLYLNFFLGGALKGGGGIKNLTNGFWRQWYINDWLTDVESWGECKSSKANYNRRRISGLKPSNMN